MPSAAPDPIPKQPPGVTVEGQEYLLPQFESITLDEERMMYLYADCVIRDFIPPHPELKEEEKEAYLRLQLVRWRDPNFKKALVAIALRRAFPDMPHDERDKLAGTVRGIEVDIAMLWRDAEDPPQSSQKLLEDTTSTSTTSRPTDSGSSTKNGSDLADEIPVATGTSESDTSSPGAPRIELVS